MLFRSGGETPLGITSLAATIKPESQDRQQTKSMTTSDDLKEASKRKALRLPQIAVPIIRPVRKNEQSTSPTLQDISSATRSDTMKTTNATGMMPHNSEKPTGIQGEWILQCNVFNADLLDLVPSSMEQNAASVASSPTLWAASPKSIPATAATEFFTDRKSVV